MTHTWTQECILCPCGGRMCLSVSIFSHFFFLSFQLAQRFSSCSCSALSLSLTSFSALFILNWPLARSFYFCCRLRFIYWLKIPNFFSLMKLKERHSQKSCLLWVLIVIALVCVFAGCAHDVWIKISLQT